MSPRRPDPKPKRRVNNDGSISWEIRFRPDPKGNPTSRYFRTHDEARMFGADVRDFGGAGALARLAEREGRTAGSAGPILDDVFTEFIAWKRSDVRSSRTIEEYESQWRHVIAPTLGHRHITDITDTDVQRWVDGMTAGTIGARLAHGEYVPLSAKSITNRHGLLHSVMDYASSRRRRYITVNPCTDTDLPKRRKGLPKGLRPGEWEALYAAMVQLYPQAADLALTMYATGARFGEATALSTLDVIEDDGDSIVLSIGHVIRREAEGKFRRVEDTKSDAGFRVVEVDPEASAVLRRLMRDAPSGALEDQPNVRLLHVNRRGKVFLPAHYRAAAWLPAVKLAGLSRNPTSHWLRHTHVQDLIAAGVPMPYIQSRIGHEHFSTTVGVYARVSQRVGRDALTAVAARRHVMQPSLPAVEGTVVAGEIV